MSGHSAEHDQLHDKGTKLQDVSHPPLAEDGRKQVAKADALAHGSGSLHATPDKRHAKS